MFNEDNRETSRKLASVRVIKNTKPIEGADAIEVVEVDGWQCVSKKNEFQVGDKCAYFEIDSLLPIVEHFEFLRKSSYRKMSDGSEGFRLKTIKLRGQLSQGLVVPLVSLGIESDIEVGTDLTSRLGVTKFEVPIHPSLQGQIRGYIPSFIRKTDEERIQNLLGYFERFKDAEFEASIKLDGASCTFYRYKPSESNCEITSVCSRNLDYYESDAQAFWIVAKRLKICERLSLLERNLAIQGELLGPSIQSNPEGLKELDWFMFNAWDIGQQRYLLPNERMEVLNLLNSQEGYPQIKHVPILENGIKIFQLCSNVKSLLDYVDGPSLNAKKREGVVFKSRELIDGQLVSFKVISNSYLLGLKE